MVLMDLVVVVDIAKLQANKIAKPKPELMWFLKAGQTAHDKNYYGSVPSLLEAARDWEVEVGLKGHGRYPEVFREFGMLPDIILHSRLTKQAMLLQLIASWESRIKEQHVFEMVKY